MNLQETCTAPPGKTRVVYFDARDHHPTAEGDFDSPEAAFKFVDERHPATSACMSLYDDKGEAVPRPGVQ